MAAHTEQPRCYPKVSVFARYYSVDNAPEQVDVLVDGKIKISGLQYDRAVRAVRRGAYDTDRVELRNGDWSAYLCAAHQKSIVSYDSSRVERRLDMPRLCRCLSFANVAA